MNVVRIFIAFVELISTAFEERTAKFPRFPPITTVVRLAPTLKGGGQTILITSMSLKRYENKYTPYRLLHFVAVIGVMCLHVAVWRI